MAAIPIIFGILRWFASTKLGRITAVALVVVAALGLLTWRAYERGSHHAMAKIEHATKVESDRRIGVLTREHERAEYEASAINDLRSRNAALEQEIGRLSVRNDGRVCLDAADVEQLHRSGRQVGDRTPKPTR